MPEIRKNLGPLRDSNVASFYFQSNVGAGEAGSGTREECVDLLGREERAQRMSREERDRMEGCVESKG